MRARLARYALWQARDFAYARGAPTLIVGALLALQVQLSLRGSVGRVALDEEAARQYFAALLGPLALFATLLGTNGIVSGDRAHGYFRLLFAKPANACA